MDAQMNYLINVMNSELKHVENIYHFLLEKQDALIQNDPIKLKEFIYKEHSLFMKSRDLEASRLSIIEVISKKINLPLKNLKLKDFIAKLDNEGQQILNEIQNKLTSLIEKIKHQNQKCEILIKKSLEIINYSMNLISGNFKNKNKMVYDKSRKPIAKYYTNSIIDTKY